MQNKYPLWKNTILILLAVAGLVYALPNLYGDDPVLDISWQRPEQLILLKEKVNKLLNSSHVPYRAIKFEHDRMEVRFSSTDAQWAAADLIKKSLGDNFSVALNLAPSTPAWLRKLGAEPMKQGLDLRGGVHLLLDVDFSSVISRRYEGLIKTAGQTLREAGVRYRSIRFVPKKGVEIRFNSSNECEKAHAELMSTFIGMTFSTLPNSNVLLVALTPLEINQMRQNTIEQTMGILRSRVNELGVGEAVVQQQGANRVAVDLPGIQDAARAKQILGGTATLQFHMVDQIHDAVRAKENGRIPLGSKLYMMHGEPLLLMRQVVLSGDSITSATTSDDEQTAMPSVQIQLGGGGEAFFSKVTRENIGQRMAIVFVETKTTQETVNGVSRRRSHREERVISAPVIQSALGSNFQITGVSDREEAKNLALLLRTGALPAAIYPVEERTVGPTLGRENIQRGMLSLGVGMGLILILMMLYYRFFGFVANIALLLNLVLLCSLLSLIGATLTLPGIAGIVLTVGMAVDANVLIYERIREELRRGLSAQAAIFSGYERAFATILDANITTFIVALVLFMVGAGPVRGFAVTLSLGLLTSMLTGVTFTRAMVNAVYGGRHVNKLSIGL